MKNLFSNPSKSNEEDYLLNIELEWLKWLSYESIREKRLLSLLDSSKSSTLTYETLNEIALIKRDHLFAELFKKYCANNCTKEEYILVYEYMCNNSIVKLMLRKLSQEELLEAQEKIQIFSRLPLEVLTQNLKEMTIEENYLQLSMVNAYILHVLCNHYAKRKKQNESNTLSR